ncbi:MAG: ATP-binding cassette domain-containing protein [Balneola sp.]|nr:ATP-binding cassette domain-containing protein [Balneola sp.]MBO6652043.1 ATP-binding cassette domain-containing protein [Balneola sp.]MBO6711042.1 ATP-binding cassette domain-containing protein [Balneola sp.]MBO6800844.1 ATP-binding cassette domain-containing protein [Balneola sp.]MBO6868977.1 ATP-binding cassette domain-containing protein [Balneola sp.]
MISAKNISKSYSSKDVLKNIDLNISAGNTVALIGPSGCGKSTLLRIIMGLIEADSGFILIDGETVSKENVLQVRQKIGYVIQKGGLFPHLTARENATLASEYLGWSTSKTEERLSELADLVQIDKNMLNRKPDDLSGGQAQRISLIRALMLDPKIILLDEPLGSIDPLVRHELQSDLKKIFHELQKTVLLVTHDLGEAAFLGNEIVLMKEGEIVQQGDIRQIISNPVNEFVEQFVSAQRSPLEGY